MTDGWTRTAALSIALLGHTMMLTALGLPSGASPAYRKPQGPIAYIQWMADTKQGHPTTDLVKPSGLRDMPQSPTVSVETPEPEQNQRNSPLPSFQDTPGHPENFTGSLEYRIRQQIRTCWKAGRIPDDRPLTIRIRMTPEGTAEGPAEILLGDGSLPDEARRETVRRAIAQCMPLNLPPELYAWWQTIDIDSRDL